MTTGLLVFTLFHVAISLLAIGSGFVVLYGLIENKRLDSWTAFFLSTTVATSVTGFFFPITRVTPGLVLGAISMIVLAVAIYARYGRRLAGHWRPIYVVSAVAALYFNVFVLIVQSFQKVPFLKALAPTQSEAPFAIAQLVALAAFLILGYLSTTHFRAETQAAA